jgi:transglutaminase-like putative cysteine protease
VYEATLRSRALVELPAGAPAPKAAPLPPAERKLFLCEHGDVNYKHETFQKWLREEGLVRGGGEDAVGFARRAFRTVRDKQKYGYAGDLDRRASAVCAAGRSDCGGLAVLFVAALRANGVPARALYGRWATSADPDARLGGAAYYQWHVKAEFYADGVGWVPADPGSAVLHDKSPDAGAYFGTDPGDFLTFHVGSNLSVEAGMLGVQAVGNLQTPGWWAVGTGTTTTVRVAEAWAVEPAR